jgi:hypothetical protein
MSSAYNTIVTVGPLAVGATQVVTHGLTGTPTTVQPVLRPTGIGVSGSPTATSVTFINNGTATETGDFLIQVDHSAQGVAGNSLYRGQGLTIASTGITFPGGTQQTEAYTGGGIPDEYEREGIVHKQCASPMQANYSSIWMLTGAEPTTIPGSDSEMIPFEWNVNGDMHRIRASGMFTALAIADPATHCHAHVYLHLLMYDSTTGALRRLGAADDWPDTDYENVEIPINQTAPPSFKYWSHTWDFDALGAPVGLVNSLIACFEAKYFAADDSTPLSYAGLVQPVVASFAAYLFQRTG